MQTKKIAVIGIGNTLRRDDGIGILILESLRLFCKRKKIDCFDYASASFDLVNKLGDYKEVVLIDGIDARLPPGELKIFKLSDIKFSLKPSVISSHELNLKDLYALCRKLKVKTLMYVAGIQVQDVEFREGLSVPLKRTFKANKTKIVDFIEGLLRGA